MLQNLFTLEFYSYLKQWIHLKLISKLNLSHRDSFIYEIHYEDGEEETKLYESHQLLTCFIV